jgi:hypothetical protein
VGQQQQQHELADKKTAFNLMMILAAAMTTSVTVFLRIRFGPEALGKRGVVCLVLLCLVAGFSREPVYLYYLAVWFCAFAYLRITTLRLVAKGWRPHSMSGGYPIVALRLGRFLGVQNESTAKLIVEPLLCLGISFILDDMAHTYQMRELYLLGWWFFMCAFAIAFESFLFDHLQKKRVQAMHDARLEQEYLMQQFREFNGE